MVERTLAEQNEDEGKDDALSNKRRKTSASGTPQDSDDGNEGSTFSFKFKKMKKQKSKGGIGYAGEQREDVSPSVLHLPVTNSIILPDRIVDNSKPQLCRKLRTARWETYVHVISVFHPLVTNLCVASVSTSGLLARLETRFGN